MAFVRNSFRGNDGVRLAGRLLVLAVASVFLQTGFVSELPMFGVRINLAPLVVAFSGFLCGAVPGAVVGFGVGLLVDLTLGETLGLSSLILLFIGYGAGRLRELRDPEATLLPLAIGGAAAFTFLVGYAVVEFLLGVHAPVSGLELVRQIALGTILDAIAAAPTWAVLRAFLQPAVERSSRRRRAYTTGGLAPRLR